LPSIYDDHLRPLDLGEVKTYPLASRTSKVKLSDFATPVNDDASLRTFLASLPDILAVQSLRQLTTRILRARELKKPIIWGIGGHAVRRKPDNYSTAPHSTARAIRSDSAKQSVVL
jgi:hypothetical protein